MKERIQQSGTTLYQEQIKDGQDILTYGFQDDVSYNPNIILYHTEESIPIKMFNQKSSASYGFAISFLSPHDTPVELGQILYDTKKNEYWLCVESFDVSGIHYDGKLGKCGHFLRWQDKKGVIQEYPMIVTSAAKYNNGERKWGSVELASDQIMVFTQLNEDTIQLDRGDCFFVDENRVHPSVYELTRTDTALYTYMGTGFLGMILTESAYTPSKEELELGVCYYKYFPEPTLPPVPPETEDPDESPVLLSSISGSKSLKVGFPRTYTARFTDENGEELDWNNISFTWEVEADFEVVKTEYNNKITLLAEREDIIEKSILLKLLIEDETAADLKINITAVA